jgi:hypothetical protein
VLIFRLWYDVLPQPTRTENGTGKSRGPSKIELLIWNGTLCSGHASASISTSSVPRCCGVGCIHLTKTSRIKPHHRSTFFKSFKAETILQIRHSWFDDHIRKYKVGHLPFIFTIKETIHLSLLLTASYPARSISHNHL